MYAYWGCECGGGGGERGGGERAVFATCFHTLTRMLMVKSQRFESMLYNYY